MSNRVIIKEGYLRKVPKKGASIFNREEKRWFIFLLFSRQPFLEYYEKEEDKEREPPINCFSLQALQASRSLGEYHNCAFILTTSERVLQLVANSPSEAEEWCHVLNQTFRQFGANEEAFENVYGGCHYDRPMVLSHVIDDDESGKESSAKVKVALRQKENVYSVECAEEENNVDFDLVDTIDMEKAAAWADDKHDKAAGAGFTNNSFSWKSDFLVSEEEEEEDAIALEKAAAWAEFSMVPQRDSAEMKQKSGCRTFSKKSAMVTKNQENEHSVNKIFDDLARLEAKLMERGDTEAAANMATQRLVNGHVNVDVMDENVYEVIANKLREIKDWEGLVSLTAKRNTSSVSLFKPNPSPPCLDTRVSPFLIAGYFDRKQVGQHSGFTITRERNTTASSSTTAQDSGSTGQSLYITSGPQRGLGPILGAVESHKKEILHPGGVLVQAHAADLLSSVAFVELSSGIFIAGWKMHTTQLHNCFRIGDQIVGVNEFCPLPATHTDSLSTIRRLLEATPLNQKARLRMRRTPYAKVFAIHREVEGQTLGLRREAGTAQIIHVEPVGLAAKHGLTAQAVGMDGRHFCHWVLTEVNNRPLNLYYNKNEVEVRLNAFGKEISLVVQPLDFVFELKKALKNLKNYKDFVVE